MNVTIEKLSFRSKHHYLTQRFVDYIEQVLCSKMFTVADVARLFDLDYGTIYKIDHEVLRRLIQELQIPDPINIAVDEKSFKKGHNYVTIVTDCDLKKVIWVSEGNKKESLDQFFEVLGADRCKKIKTVSKDLHAPYAFLFPGLCSLLIPLRATLLLIWLSLVHRRYSGWIFIFGILLNTAYCLAKTNLIAITICRATKDNLVAIKQKGSIFATSYRYALLPIKGSLN